MVDAISTNNPVANVAIPATPITPNQNVGSSAPIQSQPSVDQVSISPEAQIAAREVFSERPEINTSQAQVIDSSAGNVAVGQAANVESTEPETVTVPPPETNVSVENTESRNDAEESNPLSELVEL